MLQTYVLDAYGARVDINRAQALMDPRLAQEAAEWVTSNRTVLRERGVSDMDQAFFDHYLLLHYQRRAAPFPPNDPHSS